MPSGSGASFAAIQGTLAGPSVSSSVDTFAVTPSLFSTWDRKPVLLEVTSVADAGGATPVLAASAEAKGGRVGIVAGRGTSDLVVALKPGRYALQTTGAAPGGFTDRFALAGDVNGDDRVDRSDVAALVSRIRSGQDVSANRILLGWARRNLGAATTVRPLTVSAEQGYRDAGDGDATRDDVVTVRAAAGASVLASTAGGSQTLTAGADGEVEFDAAAMGIVAPTPATFVATDAFGQRASAGLTVDVGTVVKMPDSELTDADLDGVGDALPGDTTVSALLLLRPGSGEPESVLEGMADEALSDRVYPDRSQIAALFGASTSDVASVVAYVRSQGFSVVYTDAATRAVRVEGTADDFRRAFGEQPLGYDNSGEPWSYRGSLYLPPALSGVITGVFAVDNNVNGAFGSVDRSDGLPTPAWHATPTGTATGLTPDQVASRYDVPAVDRPGDGTNVGILEMDSSYDARAQADAAEAFQAEGVAMPSVTAYGPETGDKNLELDLDLQMVGSLAPSARIGLYFGEGGLGDLLETVQSAVFGPARLDVLSISYGWPEDLVSKMEADAVRLTFLEAAAVGMTTFVSSGDSGSEGGVSNGLANVSFPASVPYVTAAGGTMFATPAAGSPDVAWNQVERVGSVYVNRSKLEAGGGGVSEIYDEPDYQKGVDGVEPRSADPGHASGRGVPDVSALAGTPYVDVVIDGKRTDVWGTSAAAPLWAGLTAVLDQQLEAQPGGKPIGFFNPILYRELQGRGLTDVVTGDNTTSALSTADDAILLPTGIGYDATPGWDMATGWGVPDGSALLKDLQDLLRR